MQSQVGFNRVPEKVKVWEALVQSQVRFKQHGFQRRSGRLWCTAGPGQVQQGSGSGEGVGGFGA